MVCINTNKYSEYKYFKMEIELLSSRINLNHTCLKLQISIEDIKTKHPNRTDLLNSMEQSLHEIKKAMVVYGTLEKEFRATRQINFDLQHINLELKQEVKDLKKVIEFNNAELWKHELKNVLTAKKNLHRSTPYKSFV